MVIANPIYDIIFKRLMENRRIARFFVETIIGEQVEEIAMIPQEYTYNTRAKKDIKIDEKPKEEFVILSLIRFDFVATIRTAKGENKKVIIEIQKSNKAGDLLRFRTYLGEQYKRMDVVEIASGKVEKALPIITIYLLGFTIPKIDAMAIKVNRTYIDMIEQTEIKQKSEWIESLTHDGYFVQIPLVKGKPRTSLEKLLSIFEQQYFIDEKNTIKDYAYSVDDENLLEMVEVLRHAATDAKTRREMEEAWWELLNEKEQERNEKEQEKMRKEYEKMRKKVERVEKEYERVEKEVENKNQIIEKNKKSLEEKEKEIAELKRLLEK